MAMIAAAAALLAAGCDDEERGGDGAGSGAASRTAAGDVREIKRVVERFVLAKDADVGCREVTTRDLVQRIFGDVPQCVRASRSEKGDKPATGVRTSDVEVDGDSATARIQIIGGDTDGSTGRLELRRQGRRWLVDDLGVDLLRSLIIRGLEKESQKDAELRRPGVSRCVQKAFDDLSDDELKRIAYMTISERKGSQEEAVKIVLPCLARPGSGSGGRRSLLRDQFEKGIRREAREEDLPEAVIACILRRLRSSVTDKELAELAVRQEESTPAIARELARAAIACRSPSPPRSSS